MHAEVITALQSNGRLAATLQIPGVSGEWPVKVEDLRRLLGEESSDTVAETIEQGRRSLVTSTVEAFEREALSAVASHINAVNARAPQLHVNVDEPRPERMNPITQGDYQPNGGLWTATAGSPAEHYWLDVFASVESRPRTNPRWYRTEGKSFSVWKLYPSPTARVAVIDSRADLICLGAQYGWESPRLLGHVSGKVSWVQKPRFPEMVKDLDGLRVTEKAVSELEGPGAGEPRLYGWHAESSCWLRWCFERVEPLGPLSQFVKEDDPFRSLRLLRRAMRSFL